MHMGTRLLFFVALQIEKKSDHGFAQLFPAINLLSVVSMKSLPHSLHFGWNLVT